MKWPPKQCIDHEKVKKVVFRPHPSIGNILVPGKVGRVLSVIIGFFKVPVFVPVNFFGQNLEALGYKMVWMSIMQ